MKVFISHQKADSTLAFNISKYLKINHQIDTYLDVIDPNASETGDTIGEYLREELSKCTQLMAVVSEKTKSSWWVPWEIGIATEKDYPIATYAGDTVKIPEYLKKWPYLKKESDLDIYATASKKAQKSYSMESISMDSAAARHLSTQEFYRSLRTGLGQ